MRPNIYIGKVEVSAMYRRWYYEVIIDHIEVVTHLEPHFRVGWANTKGLSLLLNNTCSNTLIVRLRAIPKRWLQMGR